MWDLLWHKFLKRPYRLKKIIDQGKGPTVILLIHGLGSEAKHWLPLVTILEPKKYRIIAYDLLGFGKSPKPGWNNYTVEQHAQSILYSLSKDITPNQQFIIIGHSMGCIISAHIASIEPSKTSNLIMYEPPLLVDSRARKTTHQKIYQYYATKPTMLITLSHMLKHFTRKLAHFQLNDETWLPFERSLRNTIIAQNTITQLINMKVPTHIIYGRLDFVVSRKDAKKIAAQNPKINLNYVTEMHDIRAKSSRYIKKLIEAL